MRDMFEKATRQKLVFTTTRGPLTTQDLWELPLTGVFSLDAAAQEVAKSIEEHGVKSFVTKTTKNDTLELKLEILKHIIAVKLEEADIVKDAKERKERKEYLMDIIDEKEKDELKGKTLKELKKEVKSL